MAQYLRAICERAENSKAGEPIVFSASTEGVQRDTIDLKASQWDLEQYQKNPVFLWAHDYYGAPIGRGDAEIGESKLRLAVQFDQEDEFARKIEGKYRRGFLNAVSVGWDYFARCPACGTKNYGIFDYWKQTTLSNLTCKSCKQPISQETPIFYDLLEVSAVPVPADPNALVERQRRAFAELGKELMGEEETPQARIVPVESSMMIWRGVATAMVDLLQVTPEQMTEVDRREIYNGLEKLYKRLGKTPPEYLTAAELAALGDEELRGLLLEEEPFEGRDVRFTREALGKLSQAADLIRAVVDGAVVPEPPDNDAKNIEVLRRISASLETLGG